ncbi:MAG: aspartate--ammonia ligase [Ruminococcaceae bacterium]|nr:aspartate--ammonia ligase [Oscillospiraceae bacterium]
MHTVIKPGYKSILSSYDTQKAIALMKRLFEDRFSSALNLLRVSAPLFVDEQSGINDTLNGWERPVSFEISQTGIKAEVVQSLAKWKRLALKRYDFYPGKGLYTDMNAIRRDEDELDNLHSVYVDQWDWEKVILEENRNIDYLKEVVIEIINAMCDTEETLQSIYPQLKSLGRIDRNVTFITSQELLDLYPDQDAKQRENSFVKTHPTTFIIGIGDKLKSGKPHDNRAPDYDDWALNGDIMLWNNMLDCAMEISSMGIRVNEQGLKEQLIKSGCTDRENLYYHSLLLGGKLPLTIGGGIGQSRMSMLMLGKAHIGEVQASLWDEETVTSCQNAGIMLL